MYKCMYDYEVCVCACVCVCTVCSMYNSYVPKATRICFCFCIHHVRSGTRFLPYIVPYYVYMPCHTEYIRTYTHVYSMRVYMLHSGAGGFSLKSTIPQTIYFIYLYIYFYIIYVYLSLYIYKYKIGEYY